MSPETDTPVSRTFRVLTMITTLLLLAGVSLTLAGIALIWFPADVTKELFADDFAIHRFHAGMISAVTWVLFASVATQLRRPQQKVATMILAIVSLLILLPADLESPQFTPLELLVLTLLLAMLWFHPARSEIGWRSLHRTAGIVLALGVGPWLVYAWNRVQQQLNGVGADRHLELGHYGYMAAATLVILAAVFLGVTSLPGHRIAMAFGVAGATVFALLSILLPDQPSSAGILWGSVALVWAAALAVATWFRPGSPSMTSRASTTPPGRVESAR